MAQEEKELRKMRRMELIEIIYQLQQNLVRMEQENERLRRKLHDRRILLENAGSIAEAALRINEVFESAQRAADQYVESVRLAAQDAEQTEQAEQTELTDAVDQMEQADQTELADAADETEQAEQTELTDVADETDQAEQTDAVDQAEPPMQTGEPQENRADPE